MLDNFYIAGVAAPPKNSPVPKRRGRGWLLASYVSECLGRQIQNAIGMIRRRFIDTRSSP